MKEIKIQKEKLKIANSVALVLAFLVADNENRPLQDLQQAEFGRKKDFLAVKRFLLSARKKSITENFVNWTLRPLFVFVMIQRIFSLS